MRDSRCAGNDEADAAALDDAHGARSPDLVRPAKVSGRAVTHSIQRACMAVPVPSHSAIGNQLCWACPRSKMASTKSRTNPPRQNLAKYLFIWCAAAAAVCSRFHPVSSASDGTNHRQPRQHLLLPSLLPPPLPTTTTLLFHNPAGLFGRRSNPATYLRGHPGPSFSSMAALPLPFHHPIATHPGLQLVILHP